MNGLLLTGVVDRLRPGAARALAQLAARRLVPGGVVVLVSMRPEVAVAMDPVAADLASGRPVHPVTWCHLLARYGLSESGGVRTRRVRAGRLRCLGSASGGFLALRQGLTWGLDRSESTR